MIRNHKWIVIFLLLLLLAGIAIILLDSKPKPESNIPAVFDANRAFDDVLVQMSLGPRIPGSQSHADVIAYIQKELKIAGWKAILQKINYQGHEIQNIIASRGDSTKPVTITAAHYDSRMRANQDADPSLASQPVPGANDGASGVAVLLEMARVMPEASSQNVWLVFFDAEDQGDLPGWDWILGSQAFVENLTQPVKQAVIIDMIGDKDLDIYREKSSTQSIVDEIWSDAASLDYSQYFINKPKYAMLDDQTPFLDAGIPAVDIIDFDYPYWHTSADTADKVSPQSLKVVGDTLIQWLSERE